MDKKPSTVNGADQTLGRCDSNDIALKSLFLGPQSENSDWFLSKINEVLQHTFDWRRSCFPMDGMAISHVDRKDPNFKTMRIRLAESLQSLLSSLENETPKFTPRYIGHMVSEISLPSLLAEFAMLLHNPNNASREASKVGLTIEREAIQALAQMIGFNSTEARGHFTSGGTIANFEAVWRALYQFDRRCSTALVDIKNKRSKPEDFFKLCHSPAPRTQRTDSELDLESHSLLEQGPWDLEADEILGTKFRGPIILVPNNKHYSWPKAAAVFGLGSRSLWPVALDEDGRLSLTDLQSKIEKARLENRPILAVVSVAGTTELGEVDDVGKVQDLLDCYLKEGIHIWHHVDAAYGGFLCSLQHPYHSLTSRTMTALSAISRADSVTLDPHKLGYVPYACGAILCRNQSLYQCHRVMAPYLQENQESRVDWATTLEGSRSAAGAAAVWLTAKTIPFSAEGFGRIIQKTIDAKEVFAQTLQSVSEIRIVSPSDTNILCFAIADSNDSIAGLNEKTKRLFEFIEKGPNFCVSRTLLSRQCYSKMIQRLCAEWNIADNEESDLFVIRLVLMNPFIASKEMNIHFQTEFKFAVESFLKTGAKVTEHD